MRTTEDFQRTLRGKLGGKEGVPRGTKPVFTTGPECFTWNKIRPTPTVPWNSLLRPWQISESPCRPGNLN